jgi:hypothetical protein
MVRTVRATEDLPLRFDAVPDDPAAAMGANRRKLGDGAFEAVECVWCTGEGHCERLIVIVPASFTFSHRMMS